MLSLPKKTIVKQIVYLFLMFLLIPFSCKVKEEEQMILITEDTPGFYKVTGQSPAKKEYCVIQGFVNVIDDSSGISFVTIKSDRLEDGVKTDEEGNFSIHMPRGKNKIEASHIGYLPVVIDTFLQNNMRLEITLGKRITYKDVKEKYTNRKYGF